MISVIINNSWLDSYVPSSPAAEAGSPPRRGGWSAWDVPQRWLLVPLRHRRQGQSYQGTGPWISAPWPHVSGWPKYSSSLIGLSISCFVSGTMVSLRIHTVSLPFSKLIYQFCLIYLIIMCVWLSVSTYIILCRELEWLALSMDCLLQLELQSSL